MSRLVRLLLLALLAGTAGFVGPAQAQTGYAYDRELGVVAHETLWQALPARSRASRRQVASPGVRCYRTNRSFEGAFERRFGISARRVIAYYAGGRDVHLRQVTCRNVRSFLAGRHTLFTSAAFSILVHEALHRQGLRNERLTTCFANEAVRWGAEWLGFPRGRALRARNLAFRYTKRYSPPSYFMGRPTCLALARNRDWRDFTTGPRRRDASERVALAAQAPVAGFAARRRQAPERALP